MNIISVVITTNFKKIRRKIMLSDKFLDAIESSSLFAQISRNDIEYIYQVLKAKIRSYKSDETIYSYGDKIASVYLILEGDIIFVREDIWGNSDILTKIDKGQSFGMVYAFSSQKKSDMKAVTKKGCTLMIIPIDTIYKPFSEKHDLQERLIKNVIKTLCDKSIFLTEKLTHTSQRKLRDKIIAYLSYESIRNNSNSFYIPYSRQQLAEYLFVDRSALSNELSKLQKEGIISFRKNYFTIHCTD